MNSIVKGISYQTLQHIVKLSGGELKATTRSEAIRFLASDLKCTVKAMEQRLQELEAVEYVEVVEGSEVTLAATQVGRRRCKDWERDTRQQPKQTKRPARRRGNNVPAAARFTLTPLRHAVIHR